MILLIIGVLFVTAVVTALPLLQPDRRRRERERFVTARRLTTSWASSGEG